jgi:hypothetical protein
LLFSAVFRKQFLQTKTLLKLNFIFSHDVSPLSVKLGGMLT